MAFTLNSVKHPELIWHDVASIFQNKDVGRIASQHWKYLCKSQAADGPAHWYGFDMNPAAVAKTKLVLAMLLYDVPVEQVLQIWFSSCISLEA